MKKMLFAVILLLILSNVNVYAQTDTEILFRDMPWGTSFSELKNIFPDFLEREMTSCPLLLNHV